MRFILLMLLSSAAFSGPYVGSSISYDNDRGFCQYEDEDDFCTTLRAFGGFDGKLGESVFYDANVSYEEQLNESEHYNPTSATVTIMKRF